MNPRKYGVDERRLIQFSIFHGFVRKLNLYPVALPKEEETRKFVLTFSGLSVSYQSYWLNETVHDFFRIAGSCRGSLSLDDFAVQCYTHPRKLHDLLLKEEDFVFICR